VRQRVRHDQRLGHIHASVAVDSQLYLVADGRAHSFDTGNASAPSRLWPGAYMVRPAQLVKRGQFDRGKSLVHCLSRGPRKAFGRALAHMAVDVGIKPDAVVQRSTKKTMDRHAKFL